MSDIKLGHKITKPAQRDAVHIAIIPCVAAAKLKPGMHVTSCGNDIGKTVGIVDPFLGPNVVVQPGESFWLCLYQGSIVGMRHHWSHPEFPEADAQAPSVEMQDAIAFIATVARNVGCSYDELISYAMAWVQSHEYAIEGGRFEGVSVPEEFWDHFETVTGKKGSGHFFSCSC